MHLDLSSPPHQATAPVARQPLDQRPRPPAAAPASLRHAQPACAVRPERRRRHRSTPVAAAAAPLAAAAAAALPAGPAAAAAAAAAAALAQQQQQPVADLAAAVLDEAPAWTLDQAVGLVFGALLLLLYLSSTQVDRFIARQQRRQLGLCEECGGLNDPATCAEKACPLRRQ